MGISCRYGAEEDFLNLYQFMVDNEKTPFPSPGKSRNGRMVEDIDADSGY